MRTISPVKSEDWPTVGDNIADAKANGAITPPGSLSSPPETEGERQDQTETAKGPSSSILCPSQCSSNAASGFAHAFDKRFKSMVEERAIREGRVEEKERGMERRLSGLEGSGSREREEAKEFACVHHGNGNAAGNSNANEKTDAGANANGGGNMDANGNLIRSASEPLLSNSKAILDGNSKNTSKGSD